MNNKDDEFHYRDLQSPPDESNDDSIQLQKDNGCHSKWGIPCAKFLVAGIISMAAMGSGIALVFINPATTPAFTFGCSLVTSTMALWMDSPRMQTDKK